MPDITVIDNEIAPYELYGTSTSVEQALDKLQGTGYLYFMWNGDLRLVENWNTSICKVEWKASVFDSKKSVPIAYWDKGYRYTGKFEILKNIAGRAHY